MNSAFLLELDSNAVSLHLSIAHPLSTVERICRTEMPSLMAFAGI